MRIKEEIAVMKIEYHFYPRS